MHGHRKELRRSIVACSYVQLHRFFLWRAWEIDREAQINKRYQRGTKKTQMTCSIICQSSGSKVIKSNTNRKVLWIFISSSSISSNCCSKLNFVISVALGVLYQLSCVLPSLKFFLRATDDMWSQSGEMFKKWTLDWRRWCFDGCLSKNKNRRHRIRWQSQTIIIFLWPSFNSSHSHAMQMLKKHPAIKIIQLTSFSYFV